LLLQLLQGDAGVAEAAGGEKAAHKAAFAEVLAKWNKPGEFLSLTYSTIGTRGDVDMCVWSIGYAVDELNKMRSELMGRRWVGI
jgi:chlorite dismutase